MSQQDVQNILLPILTSIITGGFILVLVEIGNRKNRLRDKYDQIMWPFMRKLSSYFRFMSWCRGRIRFPNELNENETAFKDLVEKVSKDGGKLINCGGEYCVDDFSAKDLDILCSNVINNIWLYYDKMHPCNLKWDEFIGTEKIIAKELKEIFPNYISSSFDVYLVSKVSGDFYTDIYRPIINETYKYESHLQHYKRQTYVVAGAVVIVLMLMISMLFAPLPICVMRTAGVLIILLLIFCLLSLGVETDIQIDCYNRLVKWLRTKKTGIFRKKKVGQE